MNQNRWRWGWQFFRSLLGVGGAITLTEGFVGVFLGNCVSAQIVPDNTLGDEHSVVTPNVNINGLPAERIDGGATRDVNLFHSFSEFNVGNGQRVYFANPTGIENILTRVTGSNLSNILGTLGVDGGANLFLLNPNGIFFGPNARLDIAGSFFASTADSVVFNNGYQFSAKNPESPPLLTISVRLGLQYGSNQSGATIANSGNLTVGKDLTLAAVNLDLQGQLIAGEILTLEAQDTVKVRDSVANPFMASSGSQLLVQGNQGVDIFALNHPDSGFFSGGDLVLRSANTVGGDAHYSTSGNFRIERLDGNPGNFYSPYDPVIRANGDVIFNSYQGTSLHIFAGGKVQIPGYVWITDQDNIATSIDEIITLSNGRTISINGSAQPTLDIRAGIDWTLLGGLPGNTATGVNAPPSIFGTNATSADIEIGTIFFNNTDLDSPLRGTVFLTNQYKRNESLDGAIKVNATVIGGSFTGIEAILTGDALGGGSVIIDSRSHIALNGVVAASALEFSGNYFGNGGDITLIANGDITSNYNILSLGLLGGNINLTSNGTIALTSNQVTSGNYGFVPGKGGDINFKARSVLLTDGALLNNITIGQGDTGKLTVQATDSVEVVGTSIDGSVMSGLLTQTEGTGSAGNLTIETPRLSIRDGARVSSLTFGAGNTGTIKVQATDFVEVSGT
ncbi:MAG TPA: filamentous hemagglutinin N-terminal domain-containing protein, partial [Phormidium sp.]